MSAARRRVARKTPRAFYDGILDSADLAELEAAQGARLQDEIDLLRVATRWVLGLAKGVESVETAIKVLAALGNASTHLARLLHEQKNLAGDEQEQMSAALSEALAEVVAELKQGQ